MKNNENLYDIDYAILVPGKFFHYRFINSFIETINYFKDNNISYLYSFKSGAIISVLRNELIGQDILSKNNDKEFIVSSKPFANKIKPRKVLMFDSDIVWNIKDLKTLLSSKYDITFAPYLTSDKILTSARDSFGTRLTINDKQKMQKPFISTGGGLGFASISFEVFEKMEYPWFSVKEFTNNSDTIYNVEYLSEDLYFFKKAIDLGFSVICDPTIKVGHIKEDLLYI